MFAGELYITIDLAEFIFYRFSLLYLCAGMFTWSQTWNSI